MGRSGFNIAEQGHVVQMLAPVSLGAATTSECISMENWSHVSFICMKGAGSAATIRLEECTAFAGTGAATRIFSYCIEEVAAGDTPAAALQSATTAGIALSTGSGIYMIIEVDADELTDGYPYLRLKCADPGTAHLGAWVAVLSGGRYQKDITATAIV